MNTIRVCVSTMTERDTRRKLFRTVDLVFNDPVVMNLTLTQLNGMLDDVSKLIAKSNEATQKEKA